MSMAQNSASQQRENVQQMIGKKNRHAGTVKETIYNVSAAVSNAILVTLGMGLLLQTIAGFIDWAPMAQMGAITKVMLPAAFGAAIASQMKTNTMVMFAAMEPLLSALMLCSLLIKLFKALRLQDMPVRKLLDQL